MEEQHAEHKQLCSELDFGIWFWSLSQFTCNGNSRKTDYDIPLLNTRWRYPSFHWVDTATFRVNLICYILGQLSQAAFWTTGRCDTPKASSTLLWNSSCAGMIPKGSRLNLYDSWICLVVQSVWCHREWSLEWSHKGGQTTGIGEVHVHQGIVQCPWTHRQTLHNALVFSACAWTIRTSITMFKARHALRPETEGAFSTWITTKPNMTNCCTLAYKLL